MGRRKLHLDIFSSQSRFYERSDKLIFLWHPISIIHIKPVLQCWSLCSWSVYVSLIFALQGEILSEHLYRHFNKGTIIIEQFVTQIVWLFSVAWHLIWVKQWVIHNHTKVISTWLVQNTYDNYRDWSLTD